MDAVVGWGRTRGGRLAEAAARGLGVPYLALEDGFFRSVGLGESGAVSHSTLLDDVGVHYDATRPSRLEQTLNGSGWETQELLSRARSALHRVVGAGLSKTNASMPLDPAELPPMRRRRVLVVDQTRGDASIRYGLAAADAFEHMLACALSDEGGAEVIVRRHPATFAGLKAGRLPSSLPDGVRELRRDWRVADVLARVDAVYTVTSLLGFEALIRDIPVRCFGLPFYAGWSLTRDEVTSVRRSRRRTAVELFAAACILHTRYVDTVTGRPCPLEATLERLIADRGRQQEEGGLAAASRRPLRTPVRCDPPRPARLGLF